MCRRRTSRARAPGAVLGDRPTSTMPVVVRGTERTRDPADLAADGESFVREFLKTYAGQETSVACFASAASR